MLLANTHICHSLFIPLMVQYKYKVILPVHYPVATSQWQSLETYGDVS
jgi:hypothetical protein